MRTGSSPPNDRLRSAARSSGGAAADRTAGPPCGVGGGGRDHARRVHRRHRHRRHGASQSRCADAATVARGRRGRDGDGHRRAQRTHDHAALRNARCRWCVVAVCRHRTTRGRARHHDDPDRANGVHVCVRRATARRGLRVCAARRRASDHGARCIRNGARHPRLRHRPALRARGRRGRGSLRRSGETAARDAGPPRDRGRAPRGAASR